MRDWGGSLAVKCDKVSECRLLYLETWDRFGAGGEVIAWLLVVCCVWKEANQQFKSPFFKSIFISDVLTFPSRHIHKNAGFVWLFAIKKLSCPLGWQPVAHKKEGLEIWSTCHLTWDYESLPLPLKCSLAWRCSALVTWMRERGWARLSAAPPTQRDRKNPAHLNVNNQSRHKSQEAFPPLKTIII